MTENNALDIFDDPNTDNKAGAYGERRAPGGERADFQERGVPVQGVRDSFPDRHFVPGAKPCNGLSATTFRGFFEEIIQ